MAGALGRIEPQDMDHVRGYPLRSLAEPPSPVEVALKPPGQGYRPWYNQGNEGACVGFSSSWAMSFLNRRMYDAWWLYKQAKLADEWPGEDYDGTSVRAGFDVLRTIGHVRHYRGKDLLPAVPEGVERNEWARNADEVRRALGRRVPVVLGINWYENFDRPVRKGAEWRIGLGPNWGAVRGGHAICVSGASDRRQAVGLTNSWGTNYPPRVWLPYESLDRLLSSTEGGEAAVPVDRL